MKRALKIVGRFAFGGWALAMGVMVLITLIVVFAFGSLRDLRAGWLFVYLLLYSFIGLAGGGTMGLIAAVLDRLIKRPASTSAAVGEAADADPSVWPPAPKLP